MLKTVIIDDTKNARIALASDIKEFCPNLEIIGEADGVQSGLALIRSVHPEVLFLDIMMGDGTGFDLLQQLTSQERESLHIVFTTAYDEYALKAFRYSATDYLLKPIDPEDLENVVEKISKIQKGRHGELDSLEMMLEQFANRSQPSTNSQKQKIALNSLEKIKIVNVDEIIRCEAHNNYTLFFLKSGEQILVTETLKNYDDLLSENDFIRVHRSHLVNFNEVTEIIKTDGSYILMSNGDEVPISVRKKEFIMERLKSL